MTVAACPPTDIINDTNASWVHLNYMCLPHGILGLIYLPGRASTTFSFHPWWNRSHLDYTKFPTSSKTVGRDSDSIRRPEFFSEPLPWLCCQLCLNTFLNNSLIQKDVLPHHPWTTRPFNDCSRFRMVLERLLLENLTLRFSQKWKRPIDLFSEKQPPELVRI